MSDALMRSGFHDVTVTDTFGARAENVAHPLGIDPPCGVAGDHRILVFELVLEDAPHGAAQGVVTVLIVVSHEMGFARNAADRVVFMDEGAIVEQGPPAVIFEHPLHERTRAFISQIQRH